MISLFHSRRSGLKHVIAAALASAALTLAATGTAVAQDKAAGLSLITDTAEAGFALAVKLSQRGVGVVQSDPEVREQLRPNYSHDPNSLIATSQVIAIHFQTVAAANDYWRK